MSLASPRLTFVVLTPPGDGRLAALLDLLGRQGLAPGEHEILVAAHGPTLGISRTEALALAVASASAPWTWVMDVADRPHVNAAATLLSRLRKEGQDLVLFRLEAATPARAERLRFELPRFLPPAPIMDGPALLSRHDFQSELACAIAATRLWADVGQLSLVGHDAVIDRAILPRLVLSARRASCFTMEPICRRLDKPGPDLEDAVVAVQALRGLVDELKAGGNPSANLATRLLRRAELIALDALRGLILAGASSGELSLARVRLREAGALPIRHLGRPEATVRVRAWSMVASNRRLSALAAAWCRLRRAG